MHFWSTRDQFLRVPGLKGEDTPLANESQLGYNNCQLLEVTRHVTTPVGIFAQP